MCLKALTPFVSKAIAYFDLAYLRAINLKENEFIPVIETDFVADSFLASANIEIESKEMATTGSRDRERSLDRLVRKIRPSRYLRRNRSNSSARSDCSETLHEYLRLQESLSSFPRYREPSFLFWRKQPTKGKHRSLQGKTTLKPLPGQYQR